MSRGTPTASRARSIWAAASALRNGSMSEEFSGHTTRLRSSGARAASASVPRTWLSSTARRSALKSSPACGTLPWTKPTETGRPSVGRGTASGHDRDERDREDGRHRAAAHAPCGRRRAASRRSGPHDGHGEGHARRAEHPRHVGERAVRLAECQSRPREPAVGGGAARPLLHHPAQRGERVCRARVTGVGQPAAGEPRRRRTSPRRTGPGASRGRTTAGRRRRPPTTTASARRTPARRAGPARSPARAPAVRVAPPSSATPDRGEPPEVRLREGEPQAESRGDGGSRARGIPEGGGHAPTVIHAAGGTTTTPRAVVATTGGSRTSAADSPRSGAPGRRRAPRSPSRGERVPTRTRRGRDLDDVAGPDRGEELHVRVRREQALVAVGADAHLGGDVPERGQRVGAVDEVAGVVGVASRARSGGG